MKIVYISQHFPPEIGAAQGRTFDMSKNLVKLGHDVSVLTTFPNDKKINKWFQKESIEGISVFRSFRVRDTKKSAKRRLANYLSFAFSCILTGITQKKPDIIYATSPQLFQGVSGYILSKIHRAKFVFEVRDLWVDFAEILGQFKNKKMLQFARKLESFLYRKADMLVVVTNGYKERLIAQGIPAEKIIVITNGVDPDTIEAPVTKQNLIAKYDLENQFIVLYAGNIGAAQGLECVIEAADQLKDQKLPITFIFIGEGVAKDSLQSRANELELKNVLFLKSVPKKELQELYDIADLGLVILKEHPLFHITLPSKLFDYMAMNTPILLGVNGEAKNIVEEHEIGFYFQPENAKSLVDTLQSVLEQKEKLTEIKGNLYPTMLMHYNRKNIAADLSNALKNLTNKEQKKLQKAPK